MRLELTPLLFEDEPPARVQTPSPSVYTHRRAAAALRRGDHWKEEDDVNECPEGNHAQPHNRLGPCRLRSVVSGGKDLVPPHAERHPDAGDDDDQQRDEDILVDVRERFADWLPVSGRQSIGREGGGEGKLVGHALAIDVTGDECEQGDESHREDDDDRLEQIELGHLLHLHRDDRACEFFCPRASWASSR